MAKVDWTLVEQLGLPRIGQLGFIVDDMEAALRAYAAVYGIKTWYRTRFVENLVRYPADNADDVHDAKWDFVTGYSGRVQVELIDLRGDDHGILADFLRQNGSGLHHLGFYLSNLDGAVGRAAGMGIGVSQTAELRTRGGTKARVAFLDSEAVCGMPLELIEARRGPITIPPWKSLLELAVLLGDAEKIRLGRQG